MSLIDRLFHARFATFRGWVRWLLAMAEWRVGRLRRFARLDFSAVRRVVFVCQGNICRSPFGEAVARRVGLPTASFGLATSTGMPAFGRAVETAQAQGIDLTSHRVTAIEDFTFQRGDLLVVMEVRQARRLLKSRELPSEVQITLLGLWSEPLRPHLHDPFEHGPTYFQFCFQVIDSGVKELARRIRSGHVNDALSSREAFE
ncbi:MAG TPA: phosphotyrosine protein phosphatase [Candidatus Competibacteraceae bacterium]|nr:phosphotyrosine protein phosphatase [Candidatus Competibacteraceae bacterium]